MTDQPYEAAHHGSPLVEPRKPRRGDEYTQARIIINTARLVLPAGTPSPDLSRCRDTESKRRVLAAFLREHDVPTPSEPLPYIHGWLDCYSGQVVNPHETDGRRWV